MSLKVGRKVAFTARKESGVGKITDIIETARGLWYQVKRASDSRFFKVRAAQLEVLA